MATKRLNGEIMTGHLTFSADTTYDIGESGANRPRTAYLGTSMVIGSGDEPFAYLADPVQPAHRLNIKEGTQAAPVTSLGPSARVVRHMSLTQAQVDAVGIDGNDASDVVAAIEGLSYATADCEIQNIGVRGYALTTSTVGYPGNDACAVYGTANGGGSGRAIGAFFAGFRNTTNATAGVSGCEVVCGNMNGLDDDYNPTSSSQIMGLWISAYGPLRAGGAIVVGNAHGQQFDVGLAFPAIVSGGFTGAIRTAAIRDDSNCVTSYIINGTKTGAIVDFSGATLSGSAVGMLGPNNKTLVAARNAANNATLSGLYLNASNQWLLGNQLNVDSSTGAVNAPDTVTAAGTITCNKLVAGATTAVTDAPVVDFYGTMKVTASNFSRYFGPNVSQANYIEPTVAGITSIFGLLFIPRIKATTGPTSHNVTGPVIGAYVRVDGDASYSGTVTEIIGLSVGGMARNGGTMSATTAYGVFIEDQAATGVTNAYGIYQVGANTQNVFNGTVNCVGTNPLVTAKIGPATTQQHTLPAVTADTVTLNAATQTLASKTLTSPVINGLVTGTASVDARLTGDATTNSTSAVSTNLSPLSFAIGANEVWTFEFNLRVGSSSAAGIKVAIDIPTAATLMASVFANTTGPAVFLGELLTADATLNATAFQTVNSNNGLCRITGTVANGANAGTVALMFAKVTSGTATIATNSYMTARRIS
jgi:hypothetical protein